MVFKWCIFGPPVQILHSVVRFCEPTEVVSLALMAAPCMKEIVVAIETREIRITSNSKERIVVRTCVG